MERIQLKEKEALLNCVARYMVVAWRILYFTHLGRECPELPCSVFFEEAEWKSAVALAQLGGHLGRKHDPPPGAQALWQGLLKVTHYAEAWEAFGK